MIKLEEIPPKDSKDIALMDNLKTTPVRVISMKEALK